MKERRIDIDRKVELFEEGSSSIETKCVFEICTVEHSSKPYRIGGSNWLNHLSFQVQTVMFPGLSRVWKTVSHHAI